MERKRWLAVALAATMVLSACGGDDGEMEIEDVRSRMSPRMAGVAAVYLDVVNGTDQDDALVGASVSSDVAGRVEVHESYEVEDDGVDAPMHGDGAMDGDDEMPGDGMHGDGEMAGGAPMMGMREIASLDVPAGATVELVPGGYHLMLMELVEDLAPGDTFELTLEFEQAGEVTVTVEVRDQV